MAEPTIVATGTMHGWSFVQDSASASGSLVSGAGTPPAGSGSARLQTSSSGGVEHIGTSAFAGTKLFSIDALSYSTYVATASASTNQAPALRFDIDYDLTDTDTSDQGHLVYEPHFTETVSKGSWQTWDPLDGKWWATDTPGSDSCPESDPCTWDQVIAPFPHAGIPASSGEVQLSAGGGWPSGFDGNVDRFVIVIDGTANAFDFEP
jgi:hypothetical protein